MTEETENIRITKTYSMTLRTKAYIKEMADVLTSREVATTGKVVTDAEVLRRAVEMLYAEVFPKG